MGNLFEVSIVISFIPPPSGEEMTSEKRAAHKTMKINCDSKIMK